MNYLKYFFIACALNSWAIQSNAQPKSIFVGGENPSGITKIDKKRLDAEYENNEITHITFHHEGYADGDEKKFLELRVNREKRPADERVRFIHGQTKLGKETGHFKKFGMFAYHYAIGRNGEIVKGRPIKYKPGTHSKIDFSGHFAVVALGDFNFEPLTPKARMSYVKVMSEAQRKYKVLSKNILPHQHHADDTSCPGISIHNEKERLVTLTWIYSLQAELKSRGCMEVGTPDGIAGRKTKRAFSKFASQNGTYFKNRGITAAALSELLDKPNLICE